MIRLSDAFIEKAIHNTPVLKKNVARGISHSWSPFSVRFIRLLANLFPDDREIQRIFRQGSHGLSSLSRLLEQKSTLYVKEIARRAVVEKKTLIQTEQLLCRAYITHMLCLNCQEAAKKMLPKARPCQKKKDDQLTTLTL